MFPSKHARNLISVITSLVGYKGVSTEPLSKTTYRFKPLPRLKVNNIASRIINIAI
jgi:hypothetical protein